MEDIYKERLSALARRLMQHPNTDEIEFLFSFDACNIREDLTQEHLNISYMGPLFVYELPILFPEYWNREDEYSYPELKGGGEGHLLPGQISIFFSLNLDEFRFLFEYTEELDGATTRQILGKRIQSFVESNGNF